MLKVLSWTMCEGGGDRLPLIARSIRRQSPHLVTLLEAGDYDTCEMMARELGMLLSFGEANSGYHIAWLSNIPLRRGENHRDPSLAKTLLEIEVSANGHVIYLFATHLGSRRNVPQRLVKSRSFWTCRRHAPKGLACWSVTSMRYDPAILLVGHPVVDRSGVMQRRAHYERPWGSWWNPIT